MGELFTNVVLAVVAIVVIWFLLSCLASLVVIKQQTAMVVERFGKFHRLLNPGLHLIVPIMDRPRLTTWRHAKISASGGRASVMYSETKIDRLDLRENVLDFPEQKIITRDNVEIIISPMLRYQLLDPVRVAYETYDLAHATEKLVQTTLRSVIGDMGLDDTLASREEIQRLVTRKITGICKNWGLLIKGVELLEITPNPTIQEAMHKQIKAERERRTAKVEAEGYAEQTRLLAEGQAQSMKAKANGLSKVAIISAKGMADAKMLIAKAEADAVQIIGESLMDYGINPAYYLIGMKYVEAFEKAAQGAKSRIVYFPYETDVVGSLGVLMSK